MNIKSIFHSIFAVFTAVAVMFVAGCNDLPSEETISTASKLIGSAAGLTVTQLKIDSVTKTEIMEIVDKIGEAVPETNETFTAAWTPVYTAYVDKKSAEGKLKPEQATIVKTAMNVVCGGLDYVFDVRYPEAKKYANLVSAAVQGFRSGFETTISVQNDKTAAPAGLEYDRAAFEALQLKLK